MNFIWDIILTAQAKGIKKEEIFFAWAKECSPWYEQSFSILNEKKIPSLQVEVNPLFRFGSTFGEMFHPELEELEEFKQYLLDVSLHFLCEADLQKGITPQDIYKKYVKDNFLTIAPELSRTFSQLTLNQQEIFLISYVNQLKTGSSLACFREMVHHFYPKAILYQIKDETEQLLLYIDQKKTEEKEAELQLILESFLPLFYQISVFWNVHFGVVEVEKTMKLEEIQLF